jgi:hypothetical protein
VYLLLSIIGVLAIVYGLTIIFDPDRTATREATFSWIDNKVAETITKVELTTKDKPTVVLVKNDEQWFVNTNGKEYPAKGARVEDFLKIFTTRGVFPVRAKTSKAHESLGITEDQATQVAFYLKNKEQPVLEILIGNTDVTGKSVYLRFKGDDEVRSGEDTITYYMNGSLQEWYDLRLFPVEGKGAVITENIQRVSIQRSKQPALILRRDKNTSWIVEGDPGVTIDAKKVESYLQDIIGAEGDDFTEHPVSETVDATTIIILELSDGRSKRVTIQQDSTNKKYWATVTDTPYMYVLPEWTVNRLVKDIDYFKETS